MYVDTTHLAPEGRDAFLKQEARKRRATQATAAIIHGLHERCRALQFHATGHADDVEEIRYIKEILGMVNYRQKLTAGARLLGLQPPEFV